MSTRFRPTEENRSLLPPRSDGRPGASRGDDQLPSLDNIYAEKKESFLRRYGKRIASGIACAFVVSIFMNLKYVHLIVLWFCEIVIMIFGRPHGAEKLDKFGQQAAHAVVKGKDKLTEIEKAAKEKAHNIPGIPAHVPSLHKTPEQLAAEAKIKEEKEKRQRESARRVVIAKLENLGVPFDKEESLEKLQVQLKEAEEMQRKRPLLDHAGKIGLHVDPKEPYDILKNRIKEAELDADYQEQVRQYEENLEFRKKVMATYNARCPNPRCRRALKVTAKYGTLRCQKCGMMFSAGTARGNWSPPPMPPKPKRKTGVMDRIKGLFGR